MELSIPEQAASLIEKSQKILLVAHAKMDGDTLSATIAMHQILQMAGKKTTVACADPVPEVFSFLPETGVMEREISAGNDFVISLDCSRTQARKLRWKIEGNELKIFVTPFGGQFTEQDVRFSEQSDYDLIITLDAADRQQLGQIFEENADLFSRVPVIVFDHHASNPGFGTINVIDTKAASTTEVLFHFLPVYFGEQWKKKIDADIATLLLTGIITDTASFQNPNTTPRSLEVAADLVELGARQQEIIRNIFKTKNIPTLKLWGRVLSKIKTDPVHRMLWSTVSADDFVDTGGSIEDTNGIIDELLATAPGMEMVLLIKERDDGVIMTSIRTTTPLCDAAELAAEFGGGGHTQAAGFKIRAVKPFEMIAGEIIAAAQAFQDRRLMVTEYQQENGSPPAPQAAAATTGAETAIDLLDPDADAQRDQRSAMPVEIDLRPEQAETAIPQNEAAEIGAAEPAAVDLAPPVAAFPHTAEADQSAPAAPLPSDTQPEEAALTGMPDAAPSPEAAKAPRSQATDLTNEEFSGMLEKMLRWNPLEDQPRHPPKKPPFSSPLS